jgi:hypothetical protein
MNGRGSGRGIKQLPTEITTTVQSKTVAVLVVKSWWISFWRARGPRPSGLRGYLFVGHQDHGLHVLLKRPHCLGR